MRIATKLPLLASEVGIIVLRRKNSKQGTKLYTVRRERVQAALLGLRFGEGRKTDVELQALPPDVRQRYKCYGGASCDAAGVPLRGGYYLPECAPNDYYADVQIDAARLAALPEADVLPGIFVEGDVGEEADRGPAAAQVGLDEMDVEARYWRCGGRCGGSCGGRERCGDCGGGAEADGLQEEDEEEDDTGDDTTTHSGITTPREPEQMGAELMDALRGLLGADAAAAVEAGRVGVVDWEFSRSEPLRELKTEGFFTLMAPHIFVNGSCDITVPSLRQLQFKVKPTRRGPSPALPSVPCASILAPDDCRIL